MEATGLLSERRLFLVPIYTRAVMVSQWLGLHLVKMAYIALVGNIYLLAGALTSDVIHKRVARDYDPSRTIFENWAQLALETSLIVVSVYVIRHALRPLSHVLDGYFGFKSRLVPEHHHAVILAFAFLIYMQDTLANKVKHLYSL